MATLTKHLTDWQAGALAAERGDEPFTEGCTAGFADADAPEDKGSSEPQPQEDNERALMAALKDTLNRTAMRIERETGGTCHVHAMVSSNGAGGADGFLVMLTVAGCRGVGNDRSLDAAELQARLDCSVKLAEMRKAMAKACGKAVANG